jgi:NAD(P)-dependent dehydrogenase (short-subunit alcohol dehydrogenase family)
MPYPLPNASTDLSGQVALVIGASSGLGYRFARVLAAAGARVAIAARRMGDIAQYFPRQRIATPAQMDSRRCCSLPRPPARLLPARPSGSMTGRAAAEGAAAG